MAFAGCAIRRADGTYRLWQPVPNTVAAWAQLNLRDGEVLEYLASAPTLTVVSADADQDLAAAKISAAFMAWHLVTQHGMTPGQAQAAIQAALPTIKTIYQNL